MFVEDMTIDVLEDICHQVLDFYSQTQEPTSQSIPEGMNISPVAQSPPTPASGPQGPPTTPNSLFRPPYQNQAYSYPQIGATATPPQNPATGVNFVSSAHSSSPLGINFLSGAPPPFFTHQPPPPLHTAQQPPPPLPQQPPPPTTPSFQPPLPI